MDPAYTLLCSDRAVFELRLTPPQWYKGEREVDSAIIFVEIAVKIVFLVTRSFIRHLGLECFLRNSDHRAAMLGN